MAQQQPGPFPGGLRPTDQPTGNVPALHAPWRMGYIDEVDQKERGLATSAGGTGCFLRDYWLNPEADEAQLVIVRTGAGMVMLNRYPYANGHLLVALGESRPRLTDYDAGQRASLWALVDLAADLLERALDPQGVNIGINQGRAAGAGVPEHLHVHLVPRWGGDVNYMTVLGQVRVIPASLEAMYGRLSRAWSSMRGGYGL
ncbi:MAG: HIT domain-containing protein [Phycisphaerales bacterium]|nr:MAG: HIT domain-containing protein [Phycisphaerales bacterium]